jgi:hypothetical protein
MYRTQVKDDGRDRELVGKKGESGRANWVDPILRSMYDSAFSTFSLEADGCEGTWCVKRMPVSGGPWSAFIGQAKVRRRPPHP